MDRQKAAQYFIVAWVKRWNLLTYLKVLADGGPYIPFEQAHKLYPWLPGPYAFRKRLNVRTYLAEVNRPLSDALFDAPDDAARLKLAARVDEFVFTRRSTGYVDKARREFFRERNGMRLRIALEEASIENRRRAGGHHWGVCK